MKKLSFVLMAVLGISACNAENTVNVMGTECDLIAYGEKSTVVKCPVVPDLVAMQDKTPNAMFLEGDFSEKPFKTSLSEVSVEYIKNFKDFMAVYPDSVLVNVVPGDCGTGTTGYRVMVKEPVIDGVAMYAVANCVSNE